MSHVHHERGGLHPLLLILLGLPALLGLGVVKGCDMAREVVEGVQSAPTVRVEPEKPAQQVQRGWRI